MRGLYAILDLGALQARRIDPIAFAEAVLLSRPAALQLRAKRAPPRDTLSLLRELAPMCHHVSVPLVVNDRPDWALFAGCDMVHVGQSDIPIDQVRRLAPGIGVGVSTHNSEQLDAALRARPRYVGYGPVFETSSKENPDPVVGIAGVKEASRRAALAGVPLVAIGGITWERARSLVGVVAAVAVIGELLPPARAGGESLRGSEWLRDVAARAAGIRDLFASGPQAGTVSPTRRACE